MARKHLVASEPAERQYADDVLRNEFLIVRILFVKET